MSPVRRPIARRNVEGRFQQRGSEGVPESVRSEFGSRYARTIKVVGVLLIAAILIIPAAAARPLSRTPEGMALVAAAIGCVSSVLGLRAAYLAQQARTCIYGRLGDRFVKASLA